MVKRGPATSGSERFEKTIEYALAAGHFTDAAEALHEALADVDQTDVARGRLLEFRTRIAMNGGPNLTAVTVAELQTHAGALREAAPKLAASLLSEAALLSTFAGTRKAAVDIAADAVALAGNGKDVTAVLARLALGVTLAFAGDLTPAAALLAEADRLEPGRDVAEAAHYLQYVVMALAAAEQYPAAVSLASRIVGAARTLRADGVLPYALCLLANTAYYTADFTCSRLAAAEALQMAERLDQPMHCCYAHVCLVLATAVTGDEQEAGSHAREALQLIDSTGLETLRPTVHVGLGMLAMTGERYEEAAQQYSNVNEIIQEQGAGSSGLLQWRENWVEALVRTGKEEAAAEQLATLSAVATGPWGTAATHRCRALISGPASTARAEFQQAVACHQSGASAFEAARTSLYFAEYLLTSAHPSPIDRATAREQLAAAHAAFSNSGARRWLARTDRLQAVIRADSADCGVAQPYRVCLFGGFDLLLDDRSLPKPADTAARALTAVCLADGSLPVDQLVEQLWPDDAEGAGRVRLRNVLARLRHGYGPLLRRDGDCVRLDDSVTVDVIEFSRAARAALTGDRSDPGTIVLARRAVELYRGELLPADRHLDDLAVVRERLRRQQLTMLDLLIRDALHRGDTTAAVVWLDQAISIEPYEFGRYNELARLLDRLGRAADARRIRQRAATREAELMLPRTRSTPGPPRRRRISTGA